MASSEPHASQVELLAQIKEWTESLNKRKKEIDRGIAALELLGDQIDKLGVDLVRELASAVVRERPDLFPTAAGGPNRSLNQLDPDNPEHQRELEEAAAHLSPNVKMRVGTHRERIVRFFVDRRNRPATNAEIRDGISLMRGPVAVVLYQQGAPFEKLPRLPNGKYPWRLKPEAYQQMLQALADEEEGSEVDK